MNLAISDQLIIVWVLKLKWNQPGVIWLFSIRLLFRRLIFGKQRYQIVDKATFACNQSFGSIHFVGLRRFGFF